MENMQANQTTKKNKTWLIVLLVVVGLLILIPVAWFAFLIIAFVDVGVDPITPKETTIVSAKVIDYVEKKYGKQDFSFDRVERKISHNDAWRSRHDGFYAVFLTSLTDDGYFTVNTTGNDAKTTVPRDDFLERYYSRENADFLSSFEKPRTSINIYDDMVLDNMGRIPSLDELLDWGAVREYTVMLWGSDNKKFGDDKASRAEYVSDVAKNVADHYEITNEMKMSIQYRDNNYTYLFTAIVDDDSIELSGGLDEKHYVFER